MVPSPASGFQTLETSGNGSLATCMKDIDGVPNWASVVSENCTSRLAFRGLNQMMTTFAYLFLSPCLFSFHFLLPVFLQIILSQVFILMSHTHIMEYYSYIEVSFVFHNILWNWLPLCLLVMSITKRQLFFP